VIIVLDGDQAADALARGGLACPHCRGRLRPWSWARVRRVRQPDASSVTVRPRRACCTSCGRTQVLLPAACQPCSGEATAVIGQVLLAKAAGHGWRRIAGDLDRPPATVRRWLRRTRADHVQHLYQCGVMFINAYDPARLGAGLPVQATALGDALVALAAAADAWQRWFDRHAEVWTFIGALTRGRLLAPS